MNNVETLIDAGGEISIGPLAPFDCVAAATDGSTCIAMLVRRDGEKLNTLIKRLDKAIGLAWSDDLMTDEVNRP